MNLLQKWLVAFVVVIAVAVITVALVAGYRAESEFRRYAVLYSGPAEMVAESLLAYYDEHGGWSGLDQALPELAVMGRGHGRQGGGRAGFGAPGDMAYWVADARGIVVASTDGMPVGSQLGRAERSVARALGRDGELIGYLGVSTVGGMAAALDAPAAGYITRLRTALVLGGLLAFLVALVVAVLLTRSMVSPLRALMTTAQDVAQGQFEARVPVRGRDEIARLAEAFNQMAASLEQAEAARRAQTADIAHELRNPLAVLQSSLEALADGIYEPTAENLTPALDQVRTLNRLVEDLRTLALAEAGRLSLDLQPVDLGVLVSRMAESYQGAFREKQLTLQVTVSPSLPRVLADYARLTQVINNILLNTLRYVPSGGYVHLAVEPEGGGIRTCVIDNGPGVPADQLPRLFDRFWRGEPSRSRATGGSGLGLTIARQIIEVHGGRIWAEETPGGGLTLCFWLPVAG